MRKSLEKGQRKVREMLEKCESNAHSLVGNMFVCLFVTEEIFITSRPQVILKTQPPICLDYRAHNRPQLLGSHHADFMWFSKSFALIKIIGHMWLVKVRTDYVYVLCSLS